MNEFTDYTKYRFALDVVQIIFMLCVAIYTWQANRHTASQVAINALAKEHDKLKSKVKLLENNIEHFPDHSDLEKIHEKINSVSSSMKMIEGQMPSINRSLQLIQEHLLKV